MLVFLTRDKGVFRSSPTDSGPGDSELPCSNLPLLRFLTLVADSEATAHFILLFIFFNFTQNNKKNMKIEEHTGRC